MRLFKRCQVINYEVAYLAATGLITWSLLFLLMFYSSSSKYSHLVRDYDLYRARIQASERSALQALGQLKTWKTQASPSRSLFDRNHTSSRYMCAGIMSKNRIGSNVNFAAQSIAALLTRTQFRFDDKVNVIVFNVELNPNDNEFLSRYLDGLVKVVNISARINHSNLRINEAMDYVLILQHMSALKCNYSLIMEDDAILAYNWFPRLRAELDTKLAHRHDWAFVKLFYGYKFFDWDWLWSIGVLGKILMLAIFLHIVQITFARNLFARRFSSITLFLIFANSVSLVVFYNATCVNPMGAGIHKYRTGFSAVSVLIPHERLGIIADYIEDHVEDYVNGRTASFVAKDLLLSLYSQASKSAEYVYEPSLVQHIGLYSSVYMRDLSQNGYDRMFKSFSFASHLEPIQFDWKYFLSSKQYV